MNDERVVEKLLEIELPSESSFLKIKETLTRIGISSSSGNRLYQTAHILHKRGRYYIVHFLEMFELDGKQSTLQQEDIDRKNAIACLLEEWGLLKIKNKPSVDIGRSLGTIKIIPYKEKSKWSLISKYTLGAKI
jgi:hypothetical protein